LVVSVLAVSDEVDPALHASLRRARGAELILACGDLPFDYLDYLMNSLGVPLVFVPGNHDPDVSGYRPSRAGLMLRAGLPASPPWPAGAINADGKVVDVAGLRLAGLGGSPRYSSGPNQYTEHQQARRARALARRVWWARQRDGRGLDVLLTHAPPRGAGDGDDRAHRGFAALNRFALRARPAFLLHGHVPPLQARPGRPRIGDTAVRNVVGRHLLEITPAGPADAPGPAGAPGPARAPGAHSGSRRAR
jgi:predicted phosphodiesterase